MTDDPRFPKNDARNALPVLEAMAATFKDPMKWTRGAFARNAAGRAVKPRSKAAVCWCTEGFVLKTAAKPTGSFEDYAAFRTLQFVHPHRRDPVSVNDNDGLQDVLANIQRAIALCKKELDV